jgi:hypothetical protein
MNKKIHENKCIKYLQLKKKGFKYFIVFSLLNYIVLKLFFNQKQTYFNNKPKSIENLTNLFDLKYEKCNPILTSSKQFYVNFNGEYYPKQVPLYLNQSINFDCLNKSENVKKILLWNSFFGDSSYSYSFGSRIPFIKNDCPVSSCEITNDKSKLNQSDYVVVHMRDGFDQIPTHPTRTLEQRWIFLLYEPPPHSTNYDHFNGIFNLTATYRFDSNFTSFYQTFSQFYWSESNDFNDTVDYLNDKTGFAAAVISNCVGSSNRLKLIDNLKKHISIEVFGACGTPCKNTYRYDSSNESKIDYCKETLFRNYKFYFAFENSLCKDYVTEKFFSTLITYPIIPVVLGMNSYSNIVSNFIYLFKQ